MSHRSRAKIVPGGTGDASAQLTEVQESLKSLAFLGLQAGNVASDFVSIKDTRDGREKPRQLSCKLRIDFASLRELNELLANQVVEGIPSAKALLDPSRGLTLLDPNLMELHCRTSADRLVGSMKFNKTRNPNKSGRRLTVKTGGISRIVAVGGVWYRIAP